MTPKEIVKLLKNNGFVHKSTTGSHMKIFNLTTNKTVIAPYHNKSLKPGTENSILKQAGLK